MDIAVYSGSFNPLHKGHEAILRFLTAEAGFDKVYLVVTPQNPFKAGLRQPSGEERFRAAQAAVARHPDLRAEVLDIELRMPPPQYSVRTLDALRERKRSIRSRWSSGPTTWLLSPSGGTTGGFSANTAWRSSPARAFTAAMTGPAC